MSSIQQYKDAIAIADHDDSLGPAMRSLTPRMQGFVRALLDNGGRNQTEAYIAAGYNPGNNNAARVAAHKLAHDERILAAMHEESVKRMRSYGLMAVSNLVNIAMDDSATNKDRLKANLAILDRVGLHAVSEHKVVKEDASDEALVRRVKALSQSLGLDAKALLGDAGIVVDAEFKIVSDRVLDGPRKLLVNGKPEDWVENETDDPITGLSRLEDWTAE